MPEKQDSNSTSLAIAEETSPKVLPGTPIWRSMEPNDYEDFGAELTLVARDPINVSRQRKKGVITDKDADGGFSSDLLPYFANQLQGFMFADAREKFATVTLNDQATPITITSVTTGPNTFTAASGLDNFIVGSLVKASGFGDSANNILVNVTAAASGTLTVAETLVAEASPPSDAKLETCGFQFQEGELSVSASASVVTLDATTTNCTTLGLIPGEWIYLGGDAADNKFTNNEGYARIVSVTSSSISIEETTWTPQTEGGGTLDIQIFFGTVIKNEDQPSLIIQRTYQLERQLGNDGSGIQSEYLVGASANELSVDLSPADKITMDLSYVALDTERRDGTTGIKSGTRVSAPVQDAFNTSSDVVRSRIYVIDPTTLNPTSLFGYVQEISITINNNVEGLKAIGTLGSFSTNVGTFEVGGNITAFFTTLAAVNAIENNSDIGYSLILAKANNGIVFDIPLLSLGGGRINVEKDNPVTIPVEKTGAENPLGYTLLLNFFPYLPDGAMP